MIRNYYILKDSLNNFLQITLRFSLKFNKYFDFDMKLLFIVIVSAHMSDNIALYCYTTNCENETMQKKCLTLSVYINICEAHRILIREANTNYIDSPVI